MAAFEKDSEGLLQGNSRSSESNSEKQEAGSEVGALNSPFTGCVKTIRFFRGKDEEENDVFCSIV